MNWWKIIRLVIIAWLRIVNIIYLNFVKLQEVCAPYWCSGEAVTYGDVTVTVISEDKQDDYTRRVFQIADIKV